MKDLIERLKYEHTEIYMLLYAIILFGAWFILFFIIAPAL